MVMVYLFYNWLLFRERVTNKGKKDLQIVAETIVPGRIAESHLVKEVINSLSLKKEDHQ